MIAIIINPLAGGMRPEAARKRAELSSAALAASGEASEVFVTEGKGHARELAASAVNRRARVVIACGGDGTVNEVASALIHSEVALGIVPSGSGNGLARELGISRRPERAIAEAIAAAPRAIDAGELGGRLFFSIAGVGFDAHVAACFDRDSSGRRGFSSYVRITALELLRYRATTYRISTKKGSAPTRALFVTLANSSQWGNGAIIAPSARVDDGRLDLVVFEEHSRFATICAVPRVFIGGVERLRGASTQQVERALIESDAPMKFHVDGECVEGGTRLEARVHPGALQVAVR